MISVNQLHIYPIKSMQGISLTKVNTVQGGFKNDRILMITEPDGSFITARQYPELLKIETAIIKNDIHVTLPSEEKLIINLDDFSNNAEPTEIFGNRFTSYIAPIKVNQFISQFLQKDVQLRWLGHQLSRRTKRYQEVPVSFADGYPYLLLNKASFDYLQHQCPEKLDIRQFRANIIIQGALPFAEDGWKTIKIGEVIFDIVKPCTRCMLITMNVNTGKPLTNNEPLKTLGYFRTDEQGQIDFGVNMIARNHGKISVGDKIEVLERQPAKNYIKAFPPEAKSEEQCYSIIFEDKTIKANNKQPILEQLEQNKITLPYSCRTGICGRCLVVLKKGKVNPLTQSAIKRNNQILACSCVPKGDIVITLKK
ncbi:MOSC domain-containing protein [Gilliamella sp. Pra-s65]|uniref:YcbX family protein n=1 Tax=unclassified Gilliamella TaxID=2685620 RepID=UPI0013657B4D|nr:MULTISPECIES: YcbX family protein [unclassified Gilliamella]MWN89429.1 MOSC domain-containing protein [Gilliamella sp. Pra-s65]MWP72472.1 MOSC domain-containing protein [Gilliamella sp. Pra-s52]